MNQSPKRIFLPTTTPEDWKQLLAWPEKHWKQGCSAFELATCWEAAHGHLPPEVQALFASSGLPHFAEIEMLLAFPEWKVYMPPWGHASQSDLFVLARDGCGDLISVMVEGKAAEPFGPTVDQWLHGPGMAKQLQHSEEAKNLHGPGMAKKLNGPEKAKNLPSPGKVKRLAFILEKLGLKSVPETLHYQLLHRLVSAIMEAERFRAGSAVMVVHSFSKELCGFEAYTAFLELFGVANPVPGKLYLLQTTAGMSVYCGWATGSGSLP